MLTFAVGVYLPLSTMAAVFVGGLLRWFPTHKQSEAEAERRREQGVLFGSGLVGGAGLTGVGLAAWVGIRKGVRIQGFPLDVSAPVAQGLALLAVLAIAGLLAWVATRRVRE